MFDVTSALVQSMPEAQPGAGLSRNRVGKRRAGRFEEMVQGRQGRRRREPTPQDGELSCHAMPTKQQPSRNLVPSQVGPACETVHGRPASIHVGIAHSNSTVAVES